MYPAEVVKKYIERPTKVSLFDNHHFEFLASKSPNTIKRKFLQLFAGKGKQAVISQDFPKNLKINIAFPFFLCL